jgi:hypothetical protein
MNKFDEQYYRVDFETAKLLKDAGFNTPVGGIASRNTVRHATECINHNYYTANYIQNYSAPLIAIALEWIKEKGYFNWTDNDVPPGIIWANVHYGKDLLSVSKYTEFNNERDRDLFIIINACTHLNKA